jgi:hypothetical protein
MSETSPILGLPFLQPSQAQKEVTINESLSYLDTVVQLSIVRTGAEGPPDPPVEGDVYALGSAPSGAWAGHPLELAGWFNGAWQFVTPREGWLAWDKSAGRLRAWDGSTWVDASQGGPSDRLGLGVAADATNRLAVSSPAALLTHAGSDHRLTINKAGATDTGSLLFQSAWTGHAEMGLAGNTNFSIKVSPDGGAWTDAMVFDGATGTVSGAAVQDGPTDDTPGRLVTVGGFGLGGACADLGLRNLDDVPGSGFWGQDNPVRARETRNYPRDGFDGTVVAVQDPDNSLGTQIITERETQDTYLRTLRDDGQWSQWRSVVLLGSDGGRTFDSREALVAYLANPPVDHQRGDVFSDGRVRYFYAPGENAIPDLPNLVPQETVTPLHWGAVADGQADDTFAVEAAWLYWRTLETPSRRQNPDADQQDFYFPTGHYRSDSGLILETDSTGSTVYGDGPVSQLDGIGIHLRSAWEFELRDLRFRGAGDYAVKLSEEARDGSVTGLYIRDRDLGIVLYGAKVVRFVALEVFKCRIGLLVLDQGGSEFVACQFSSCLDFCVDVRGGGQLKMTNLNCSAAGANKPNPAGSANMRLKGSVADSVVENYFTKVSLSEAAPGGRQSPIVSIRNNGLGKVRVTTLTPHELFPGFHDLRIKGTQNYDDPETDYDVLDVLSPTVFDADIDFVADEDPENNADGSQGTLWIRGWDLLIEAETLARQVNDQFFTGGNINYTKIDAGFNLNFNGTRLKEQVWIGDSLADINRIFFVRNGRGRSSETTSDTPVTGPGAVKGWGEVGFFDDSPNWAADGGEKVALRMPNTGAGLTQGNTVAQLNEVSLYSDHAQTTIAGQSMIVDTSGENGALKLSLPVDGLVEAANAPKAWGRVEWIGGNPELTESYNIDRVLNETSAEDGRCTVIFNAPFASDASVLPLATPITPGADGITIQPTLIEANRIKFEGKLNGVDAQAGFVFFVYGRLA